MIDFTAPSTRPTTSPIWSLVSLRFLVSVSTLLDDLADLLLVDRLDQPLGRIERRIELVGRAGQLVGKLGDAGQEIVDAVGIVGQRLARISRRS